MARGETEGFPEIPGYRIEGILGRGSMATVYRGRQHSVGRTVAIKVLHDHIATDDITVRRLMREARIAARFNHPHIVRAHDAGVHGRHCYFVMEHVEGASVRDLLDRSGPFSEERAVRIAIEIAEALHLFHHEHVVHRDIKPANILVDGDGNALLADLGLAKIEFDSSMTSRDRTVGTPAYMSPEQARQPDTVDGRSDFFSLGTTLYHMVTGVSPFDGPSVGAVLTRILYEDPPPVRTIRQSLSPEIEAVIGRLLEKDRERRYHSPGLLLRDLRAIERGRVLPGDLARRERRRRLQIASLAAVALVALGVWVFTRDRARPESNDGDGGDGGVVIVVPPEAPTAATELGDIDLLRRFARVARTGEGDVTTLEAELGRRMDVALSRLFADFVRRARDSREGEEPWHEEHVGREFAAMFGERFEALPRWMQLRFAAAAAAARQELERFEAEDRRALVGRIEELARAAVSDLVGAASYLSRPELVARLTRSVESVAAVDGVDSDSRQAVLETVADELLVAWRHHVEERLDAARTLRDAARFARSRSILDEERARGAETLGEGFRERLGILETRLAAAEDAFRRELVNRLALIDHTSEAGHRELAEREFGPLLEELGRRSAEFAEDRSEHGPVCDTVELFVAVEATVACAQRWLRRLPDQIASYGFGRPLRVSARDGLTWSDTRVRSVDSRSMILERSAAPDVEVPLRSLSVEAILAIGVDAAEPLRSRAAAFLLYCDGDLLAVERTLGDLAPDDPVRSFLSRRVETAWPILSGVVTDAEKAAFTEWSSILAAYRRGDWRDVRDRARNLIRRADWNETAWYGRERRRIADVYAEARANLEMAEVFASRRGRYRVLDLKTGLAEIAWDFESADQKGDFTLPPESEIVDGRLARLRAESEGTVAPPDVTPMATSFPVTFDGGVGFELAFSYRADSRATYAPRCLTISLFGHHVSLLSRLQSRGGYGIEPLHGVERTLDVLVDFGLVAAWSGGLDGYERAFAPLRGRKPVLILEPGQSYSLRVVLDPKNKKATLLVDGIVSLSDDWEPEARDDEIAIRAPMPHSIDDLRCRGAVRR